MRSSRPETTVALAKPVLLIASECPPPWASAAAAKAFRTFISPKKFVDTSTDSSVRRSVITKLVPEIEYSIAVAAMSASGESPKVVTDSPFASAALATCTPEESSMFMAARSENTGVNSRVFANK